MKKNIIVLILLLITALGAFGQENQTTEEEANNDNFNYGIVLLFGLAKMTHPPSVLNNFSSSSKFDFGLESEIYGYFSKNLGLYVSIGLLNLNSNLTPKVGSDRLSYNFIFLTFDFGFTLRFNNVYVNSGILIGIKLRARKSTLSGDFRIDNTKTPFGITISAGYRIDLGKVIIPIGVKFKYFLTKFVETENIKAWGVYFTIGFF